MYYGVEPCILPPQQDTQSVPYAVAVFNGRMGDGSVFSAESTASSKSLGLVRSKKAASDRHKSARRISLINWIEIATLL